MALPSFRAAFGFPTPPHHSSSFGGFNLTTCGWSQLVAAAGHGNGSDPDGTTMSSAAALKLSPRSSNGDGDFDHEVHSDCSSNSE